MKSQGEVVAGVKEWSAWWIAQRRKKLEEQLHDTMSINPFLMPFLFEYHNLDSFGELAELVIASHLMIGHSTGFGKLIDEKILPNVFNAQKLDSKFRKGTKPFGDACFDEIDHIVTRADGRRELLSLKAGKWTIQLTMAVQLNTAFNEIITQHHSVFDRICVGVFYGKNDDLTDKYDILRGINRGANHNVIDCSDYVSVKAGKDFWSWLNGGEDRTQNWVLLGLIDALKEQNIKSSSQQLLSRYASSVERHYKAAKLEDGTIDWEALLTKING